MLQLEDVTVIRPVKIQNSKMKCRPRTRRIVITIILAITTLFLINKFTLHLTRIKLHQITTNSASQYALLTIAVGNPSYKPASLSNKQSYCNKQSIDCHFITFSNLKNGAIAWQKILSLNDIIDRYEWVWLLDLDAFITNLNISVFDITKDCQGKFLFSVDYKEFGLNAGSLFVSRRAKDIIPSWLEYQNKKVEMYEQGALKSILESDHGIEKCMVPLRMINSYCPEHKREEFRWQNDDLVIHFPGQCKGRLIPFVKGHLKELDLI